MEVAGVPGDELVEEVLGSWHQRADEASKGGRGAAPGVGPRSAQCLIQPGLLPLEMATRRARGSRASSCFASSADRRRALTRRPAESEAVAAGNETGGGWGLCRG
jgi:hypothetical protein